MKKWSTYILAALVLAGCSDEIPDNITPPDSFKEEGEVVLTIQFPDSGGPSTYAIDNSKENKISNLHILSFTSGGGTLLDDKLAYHIFIPGDSLSDLTGDRRMQKVTTKLTNMIERQRLVLIANLPSGIDLADPALEGATMATIVDKLRFGGSAWRPPVAITDTTSFPMFGQMTDSMKFHSTAAIPSNITFNMVRAVAKIDVGIDINGTDGPALGFGDIFKIDTVYVYNSSDSGYIAPHRDFLLKPGKDINFEDTVINKVNIVGSSTTTEKRVSRIAYKFPDGGSRLGNIIYIPESDILSGSYTPAYLVIKAFYYGSPSYYRIDFTDYDKFVPVLRNHNYVFNIKGIRTEGYATLEEAKNAPASRLNVPLMLDQSDDISIKEIVSFNNEYYLGVSTTNLKIDWEGGANSNVTIYLKTSYPQGWNAPLTEITNFTGFIGRRTHEPNRETVLDSIKFPITNNLTGAPKVYTFNIKAGVLTQKITVTQSPGSNSYMGLNEGGVKIPITSANADGVDRLSGHTISTGSFEVLWNTGLTLTLNYFDRILTVTSHNGSRGNAIIGMKDITGKILYSWHFWVPENNYNPEDAKTQKSNNGFIFMDRNLGAVGNDIYYPNSHGLYYQWGRKDPFLYAPYPITVDTIKPYTNYLDSAFQHPRTFYAVPFSSPFDWIGTGQNNNLWNTINDEKGPYDPCPFGWRVPIAKDDGNGSPWYGFTNNTRNGAEYPLAGYLDAFSGVRYDVGVSGGVWGASTRVQKAFTFTYGTAANSAKQTSMFRAYAYPVRCVKDKDTRGSRGYSFY